MRKKTSFSLEVFPPKVDVAIEAIYRNLYEFASLAPDYISVTYSAGGSGGTGTEDIAATIEKTHGIKAIAHITCMGETQQSVTAALDKLRGLGVNTVLALRGDRRPGMALTDFTYATDLIEFIKKRGDFGVFATCYPEGHAESESYKQDVEVMCKKYALGAERFVSQLFFDNEDFYRMRDEAVSKGVNAPIAAGIMPITNVKQILRMVSMSGAKIPASISKLVSKFENNPDAFRQAGLNFAVQQITDLICNEVDDIHLYTMNNPNTARCILESVGSILAGANE